MMLRIRLAFAIALWVLPSCTQVGSVGRLNFSDLHAAGLHLVIDPALPVDSSTQSLSWSTRASTGATLSNIGSVYTIQYSVGNTLATPTVISGAVSPLRLTSLRPATDYTFQVIEKIAGTEVRRSDENHFTTLPLTPGPATFVAIDPALDAFSIRFTAGSNASSHTLFYGTDPALVAPASIAVTSNPMNLGGLAIGTDYYFYLRASNASGHVDTAIAHARTLDAAPVPPATLRVVSGLDSLALSWSAGTGTITGYRAELNTISDFSATANPAPVLSGFMIPATLNYNFTGLQSGKLYYVRITALNSSTSASGSVQTSWTLPVAPAISPVTSITTTGATLSWGTVTGSLSEQIKVVLAATGASVTTQNHTPTAGVIQSFSLTGLLPDTGYSVTVSAINAGGSSTSGPISFRTLPAVPLQPISLLASNLGQTTAMISWSPAATGGVPSSYLVSFGLAGGVLGAPVEVFAPANNYSLNGLQPGSNYTFSVVAKNGGGNSIAAQANFATQALTTQNAPTSLTATSVTTSGATVSWTPPSGTAPASYAVKWGTMADLSSVTATSVPVGTTSFNLGSALNPGTLYYFQVASVFAGGGTQAASSQFYTKPVAPSGVSVVAAVDSLVFSGYSGNGAATTYSIIYGVSSALGSNGPSGATASQTLTLTGLSSGTQLYYKIVASANGVTAQAASASSVWTLPSAPVLALSSKSSTTADLTWAAVTGASKYRILYATNSSMTGAVAAGPVTSTSITLSGLLPSTQYYVQAFADNAGNGSSKASNTVSLLTEPQAPAAPVSLSVTVSGLIPTVKWKAGIGGGAVDSISIQSSTEASFLTPSLITSIGPISGLVSDANGFYSQVLPGFGAGGVFYVRVIANNVTASTPSTAISFLTQPTALDFSFGAAQISNSPANTFTSGLSINGGSGASTLTLIYGLDPALVSNVVSMAVTQGQVLSGLFGSRTYYGKLVAANSSGTVSSLIRSISTPLESPTAPTGVAATVTGQSAVLTWSGGASVSQTAFGSSALYSYFTVNCAGCHQNANGSGYAFSQHASGDVFTAHKSMFTSLSNGTPKLNLAVPESSGIYTLINSGHQGYNNSHAAVILTYLKQWIAAGAGSGGITTSFSYKLGTSATLAGVVASGASSPLSITGLTAGQTYYYQILSNNPSAIQTSGAIQSFVTAGITPPTVPTPIPVPSFETELRVADRRYVDELLRSVFGLAAVSSTNTGAALIVRQNIWERPEFGGACDRYAGIITGITDVSTSLQPNVVNYVENCFNGVGVLNPAKMNQARLALIAKTCDALVNDSSAMGAVMTKLYGSTTAGTVDSAHIISAYQLFYPDETPSQTVQDKLVAVGTAFGATPALQWKGIMLGICGSPGWQAGY
jgi:hypothetical protein